MKNDSPTVTMSQQERQQLERLARLRNRVAKSAVTDRKAALRADAEAQLAKVWQFDDAAWDEITRTAEQAVELADASIAELCDKMGIPTELRPRLGLSWYGRGQNAIPARRNELRRVAFARIDEVAAYAVADCDRRTLVVLTELIAGSLTSDGARQFLEAMPSVEELMPTLDVLALERHADPGEVDTAGSGGGDHIDD